MDFFGPLLPSYATALDVEKCTEIMKRIVIDTRESILPKSPNDLLHNFLNSFEKSGYNLNFFEVVEHHCNYMIEIFKRTNDFSNLEFKTCDEVISFFVAKLFINKISLFDPQLSFPVSINYSEPIEAVPIHFWRTGEEARIEFEKEIHKYDLLFVEVPKEYEKQAQPGESADDKKFIELRIISKVVDLYNNTNDLDCNYHLNSRAFMFRGREMERLRRDKISKSEILLVLVLGKAMQKIIVTTNLDCLRLNPEIRKCISLGFVPPENLPFNIAAIRECKDYATYVRNHDKIHRSSRLKEEIESLGIDPFRIYSFVKGRDGMTVPPSERGNALVKAAKHNEASKHLCNAKKYADNQDHPPALECFDESLKYWPDNFQVFESRGKMYLSMCKKRFRRGDSLFKAVLDFETALSLNPNAVESQKSLSGIYVYLSKRLVNKKSFEKARQYVHTALKIYPDSQEAKTMLEKIDKKEAKYFLKEEVNVMLQKQKELIEKQLTK